MFRSAVPKAALCIAVLTAACGGSNDRANDRDAIDRMVRMWFTAVADGDARTACGLLTASAKAKLAANRVNSTARDGDEACADAVAEASQFMTPEMREAVRTVRVTNLTVRGDRAELAERDIKLAPRYAHLKDPVGGASVLRRTPDGWKIAGLL